MCKRTNINIHTNDSKTVHLVSTENLSFAPTVNERIRYTATNQLFEIL